jgi:hypothetical protein
LPKSDFAHDTAAEPLYRRALEIVEKSLGAEHPLTQTVRENLARLLEQRRGK